MEGQWAKTPVLMTSTMINKEMRESSWLTTFIHISRGRLGYQETFLAMFPKILHTHGQSESSSLS